MVGLYKGRSIRTISSTVECVPLVALDHLHHAYGHLPLLDDVTLQVEPGERVAIIGRNGAGKSTLLQILSGELAPDRGTVWREPGARVARLVQDVPLSTTASVFDVVAEGLGDLAGLVQAYHHAAVEVAHDHSARAMERLGALQHELEERDGWRLEQRVELVLSRLSLAADLVVDTLSGGWKRRVLLARALVAQPELLLLDEPTNHLDVEAIEWLEAFLLDYAGAVVFVTHDRAFLERLATRIVELDRGRLTSWAGDYATFVRKKEEWLANEGVQQEKFDKRLAQEEAWLRQGIKARRTRDEGRVKALMAMRVERAARREQPGRVRLDVSMADATGKMVFEAEDLRKGYGDRPVVADFSTRILRGDRVGLIGPNGAGKTTLLRLLVGELKNHDKKIILSFVLAWTPILINFPNHLKQKTNPQFEFNKMVIDSTRDLVCAYKPNSAFYEAIGEQGIRELKMTCDYLHENFPEIPLILDAKRGDIGNTNKGYIDFAFNYLLSDAITLQPYLGSEAIQPFLKLTDKGIIILCKTSNPGGAELQDLIVGNEKLYKIIAKKVAAEWNKNENCLLVVGATYPEELARNKKNSGGDESSYSRSWCARRKYRIGY